MQKLNTQFADSFTAKPLVMRWFADQYPGEEPLVDVSAHVHRSQFHDWFFDRYVGMAIGFQAVFIATPERIAIRADIRPFLINLIGVGFAICILFSQVRPPACVVPLAVMMVLFYLFTLRPHTIHIPADLIDHISVQRGWQNSTDKWAGFRLHLVDGRVFHIEPSWPVDVSLLEGYKVVPE